MIREIIELVKLDDYKGKSELIDIAKGKYKFPETLNELRQQIKNK